MRRLLVVAVPISILVLVAITIRAQSGPPTFEMDVVASYLFNTLRHPTGLTVGPVTTTFYIVDSGNYVIRGFTPSSGQLTIVAGTIGASGFADGSTTAARFNHPTGITGGIFCLPNPFAPPPGCSLSTRLLVSDTDNVAIRRICTGFNCATPAVTTAAGSGGVAGYVNGTSLNARFRRIAGQWAAGNDTYICDAENHVIREWDGTNVTTFAGTGTSGYVDGPRLSAKFSVPIDAVKDSSGNLYITEGGNHTIRKIDTSGNVTTLAGNGVSGYANGVGTAARFNQPTKIVYRASENVLYVADTGNNTIRRVTLAGAVTTYSGATTAGLTNGTLFQARYSHPMGLMIINNFMYVADSLNNVIRRIDMTAGTVISYIS
jgi:DNA-binding beta-propeller fold protein YncE